MIMMRITEYEFIKKLSNFPFIDEIWLFGSRARGDNFERSDIDIAVICPTATPEQWQQVIDLIENADTLLKIDCIRYEDSLNSVFKNNILRDKKILYHSGANIMETLVWKDYFESLGNAIDRLSEILHEKNINKNEYMRDATIKRFEFVIELFWKALKKILAYEKIESTGPRDVLSKSFQIRLIDDEAIWLHMIDDRNNSSHVYRVEDAIRIFESIKDYHPILVKTYEKIKSQYQL